MRRTPPAWLVCLPFMVAGSQAAHALSYRLHTPDAAERQAFLEHTGHGYLPSLGLLAAVGAALVAVGLVRRVHASLTGGGAGSATAAPFLVLPALAFTLQEYAERLAHDGAVPWGAALEPTFLPGLLLQVPFGLAAYVAVRWLLRAVTSLAWALARRGPAPARRRPLLLALAPAAPWLPRRAPLADAAAGRGPPALALT